MTQYPFFYDDEAICETCKRAGAIKWLDGRHLCVACFADEQRKKALLDDAGKA